MSGTIITILITVFASSGFWALVQTVYNNKHQAQSAETEMLLGLAHDRIFELCKEILRTGDLSQNDYDNLLHLYEPYKKLGGNGTAEKLINEVKQMSLTE